MAAGTTRRWWMCGEATSSESCGDRPLISPLDDHAGADGFFESEFARPFGLDVVVQPHGEVERPLEVRPVDEVRDDARVQEALVRVQQAEVERVEDPVRQLPLQLGL